MKDLQLLFYLFCFNTIIYAQIQTVRIPIKFQHIKPEEKSFLVSSSLNKKQQDSVDAEGRLNAYYKFSMAELFELDKALDDSLQRQDIQIIVHKKDSFLLIFDKNANNDFSDDSVFVLPIFLDAYKKFSLDNQTGKILSLELDRGNGQSLKFNMLLALQVNTREINLIIRPLIKYRIDSLIGATIYPSNFLTQILLDKDNSTSYFPNEFMPLDSMWCSIDKIDYLAETATISFYTKETKPLGSRAGYFTDLNKLKSLTVSNSKSVQEWTKTSTGYSLLHFWGPWCGPCRKEFDKLLQLESFLAKSAIHFVNYAVCFDSTDVAAVNGLLEDKKIPVSQVITLPVKGCQPKNRFLDGCNVFHILDVLNYPDYILLSPDGKILYRGAYGKELMEKVNKLMK